MSLISIPARISTQKINQVSGFAGISAKDSLNSSVVEHSVGHANWTDIHLTSI
jgi:hypothetical protein